MNSVSGQLSAREAGSPSLFKLRSEIRAGREAHRERLTQEEVETLKHDADAAMRHLRYEEATPAPERRGPMSSGAQTLASRLESISTRPLILDKYYSAPPSRASPEINEHAGMSARASSRGRPVELEEALAAIRAGAREADDHAAMMSRRSEVVAVGDVMAELTQRKEQLEVQRRVRLEKDWITSRPGGGPGGGRAAGGPRDAGGDTSPRPYSPSRSWRREVDSHLSPPASRDYYEARAGSPSLSPRPLRSAVEAGARSVGSEHSPLLGDAVSLLNQRVERLRGHVLHLQQENAELKLEIERRRGSETRLAEENAFLRRELTELAFVSREEVQRRARRAAYTAERSHVAMVEALDRTNRTRRFDQHWHERWAHERDTIASWRDQLNAQRASSLSETGRAYDFLERSVDGIPSTVIDSAAFA